eukprot:12586497-Alexandrium_andersonii.AAC.1
MATAAPPRLGHATTLPSHACASAVSTLAVAETELEGDEHSWPTLRHASLPLSQPLLRHECACEWVGEWVGERMSGWVGACILAIVH